MRLRVFCLALFVAGCSLNPQPLPPDNPDGGGLDGMVTFGPEAGGGVDASEDGAVPTGDDASVDATVDAALDGSDAATDAAEDASDASADDAADAGEDG